MKPLIQKELKEGLKLALIGLLVLSLVLLLVWRTCNSTLANLLVGHMSGQMDGLQPLLSNGLLVAVALTCAIFGALLGSMQAWSERHRDLWGFLVHRPVTRTQIFLAKSIAGLALYALGAGLPLAVLVAVVRTPGQVAAPFEWAMTLPLFFAFLTGIPFYFAGLLTGLRQARWYVSRVFGIGPAFLTIIGTFAAQAIGGSLIWVVVGTALLAVTVWGAYQSGGFYRGQPVAGKWALTGTLAMGCGVALFVSLGLFLNLAVDPFIHGHSQNFYFYQMTRDGIVYKVTWYDGEATAIDDLAGQPLLDPKTGRKVDYKEFQKKHLAYGPSATSMLVPRRNNRSLIEDTGRFFSLLNITDKTLWYLDRHGRLLGYDGPTRRFIGFLNPLGRNAPSTPEPFLWQSTGYFYYNSYTDNPRRMLPTAQSVYAVDFKERVVNPVFSVSNDDEIGAYTEGAINYDGTRGQSLFITTRKRVCLVEGDGRVSLDVPYSPGYAEYPEVQIHTLIPGKNSNAQFAVWFHPDDETNQAAGWKIPIHALWVGPDQTIIKSADLPSLRQPDTDSWTDQALMMLALPVLHVLVETGHWSDASYVFSSWHVAGYVLCLVLAAVGWLIGKRYRLSARACAGWAVFIFVVGLPGLLAFLCAEDWPQRESCPNCKKLRVVDHESCAHCAALFPPPARTGTEIFAPLTSKV